MNDSALIYGHSELLNQTRKLILEQAGIKVFCTDNADTVVHSMTAQSVEVLVLCHTLSMEVRDYVLGLAHELHPEMKTLVLYTSSPPEPDETLHRSLGSFDGPVELKAAISALLRTVASESG